ncbi:MAG: efflux RND transporter periplasmic adaptor subunit [Chloroflexi bacterium]|nr:efflux RND transporter periplasmic adaptor subunit [Chloroflexota bacterium]
MNHKRPPIQAIVVVLLLVAVSIYFIITQVLSNKKGALTASGTIEATQVNVAPEMAGKVTEVLADEGQAISVNDPLLQLDPSLLAAQRAVAAASLESAKAGAKTAQNALSTAQSQYQIALEAALAQDKKTRTQDWFSKDPNRFEQPDWYFSRTEQLQAAQDQVDIALKALEEARANLENVNTSVEKSEFLKAEKRLLNARLAYSLAKDVNNLTQNSADANAPVGRYNSTHCGTNEGYRVDNKRLTNRVYGCRGDENLTDAGENLFDAAEKELDDAQKAYDELLDTQAADDVLLLRAEVSVAQERYYAALDYLRKFQTGEQSTAVTVAEGALSQAQAAADQAQMAVGQAQANLDLIDTQIAKLTIPSPMHGVVLTRNVEVGEFVQPGATAFVLGELNNLTITVYVPENRYGKVSIGQQAELTVDSFPDLTFTAEVIQIANKAEFTPRNVQTVEGRSSTVYAIKLKVNDPDGKLKIGMPADVVFK